ncbi:MAG: hypothetical protein Q8P31_04040 [Bacillota bacterium]|nr:hypothetical protein [Bacillota bacterium]
MVIAPGIRVATAQATILRARARQAVGDAGLFAAAPGSPPQPTVAPDPRPDAPPAPVASRHVDASAAWPPELTRRLRVFLHTLPLDTLRRSDSLRDPQLRHYDGLALALRVLDTVIERMGLEGEATSETVARQLDPILSAMDQDAGIEPSRLLHDLMVDKLLTGLRNEGEARRPFRQEYTAIGADGRANRHFVEFRLLHDSHHPDGSIVLRATNEAANLYLRLLDLDIEDAQAATEAVVQSQLERGRFDEAVLSARQARIQSIRFQEKVSAVLRDTRRDVDRVDWQNEAPRLLEDALEHIKRRMAVEGGILEAAEAGLSTLDETGTASGRALAVVAELTRDCYRRHAELHGQLIGARNVFLEAQAAQSFSRQPSRPWPELLDEVLTPLLGLPRVAALRMVNAGFPRLVGPRAPSLLDLTELASWLLAPRRPNVPREIPVEPMDPADIESELRRYPPEIRKAAFALIQHHGDGVRLSDLLAAARAAEMPDTVSEVLALLALQGFEPEDRAAAGIGAELIQGRLLDDHLIYGNDLLIALAARRETRSAAR